MSNETHAELNGTELSNNVPEWVELIPSGNVVGRDGRAWNNNNPQRIIDSFESGGMDLPIDIEHSTEIQARKGEPAPAVGWIKKLMSQGGTIWGKVEWNNIGKQLVGTRQYRYLSPVILYEKGSRVIASLSSAALTNTPNLKLMALNKQSIWNPSPMIGEYMSEEEREICRLMGTSEEDYIRERNAELSSANSVEHTGTLSQDERKICAMLGVSEDEYIKTACSSGV